jgi:hypothetical protein
VFIELRRRPGEAMRQRTMAIELDARDGLFDSS